MFAFLLNSDQMIVKVINILKNTGHFTRLKPGNILAKCYGVGIIAWMQVEIRKKQKKNVSKFHLIKEYNY